MPVYIKVTDESDIITGGKYLLITEVYDKKYALTNLTTDYVEEQMKSGIYEIDSISSASLEVNDNAVDYMTAKN